MVHLNFSQMKIILIQMWGNSVTDVRFCWSHFRDQRPHARDCAAYLASAAMGFLSKACLQAGSGGKRFSNKRPNKRNPKHVNRKMIHTKICAEKRNPSHSILFAEDSMIAQKSYIPIMPTRTETFKIPIEILISPGMESLKVSGITSKIISFHFARSLVCFFLFRQNSTAWSPPGKGLPYIRRKLL